MARHALGRNAKFARAIGRIGSSFVVVFAVTAEAPRAAPPPCDDHSEAGDGLAPLPRSDDARVVLALAAGEPVEIVASWTRQVAPRSRLATGIAAAIGAADRRWPADAILELIEAERRAAGGPDAPELPPALLDLADELLRPQSHFFAPPRAAPRLTVVSDGDGTPDCVPVVLPLALLPAPVAVVPDELRARLGAADAATVVAAWEELDRRTAGRALPAALLPTLVQLALHGPPSLRVRAVARFTDVLEADPAPLAEWWRFRHEAAPADAALLVLRFARWGERALPLFATIASEGGAADRAQVLRVLADATTPFGQSPAGDELLATLLAHAERDGVALADIARPLARLGPAAIAPLARAFDDARAAAERVELAAALIALDARRADALAAARDALGSPDGAVRRAAWIVLARAHRLDVDDSGVVRPG